MGSYFSHSTDKVPNTDTSDILLKNLSQLLKTADLSKLTQFQKECLQNFETDLLTNSLSRTVEQTQDVAELRELILREQEKYVNVLTCFTSLLVDMSPQEIDEFDFFEVQSEKVLGVEGKLEFLVKKGLENESNMILENVMAMWLECFKGEEEMLKLIVEEYGFLVSSEVFVEHPKRVLSRVKFWENHLFKKIGDLEVRKNVRDERSGFMLRCTDKAEAEKVISRTLTKLKQQEDDQKMHVVRSHMQNELKLALEQVRHKLDKAPVCRSEETPVTDSWSEDFSSSDLSSISPRTARSHAREIPLARSTKESIESSFSSSTSSRSSHDSESSTGTSTSNEFSHSPSDDFQESSDIEPSTETEDQDSSSSLTH